MIRCAIYTRYSSTLQNDSSLADQERECRAYAERNGWRVVETYSDAAISGGSEHRPGFRRLQADAEKQKFDVILAESIDRLARNLAVLSALLDHLSFQGIRLHTKDHGEINKMHAAFMGLGAEQYLADLREKTKRGQRGRVLDGKSAGGLGYGYAVEGTGERSIVPHQAKIIERIFQEYANGISPREIANRLNAEDIPGPRGSTWKDTTIRGQRDRGTGILNNEAYIGKLIYGRTEYRKNPKTGKKTARIQPKDTRTEVDAAKLRIISDDLWNSVKQRQQVVTVEMPRNADGNPLNRAHRKTHVLSGLIRCGCCDGRLAITAMDRYGCSNYRSSRSCSNKRTIPRSEVEDRVLSGLRQRLFDTDLVGTFAKEFERQLTKLRKSQADQAIGDRDRLKDVETKIERLIDSIENGAASELLTLRIQKLEAERSELQTRVGSNGSDANVVPIGNLAAVYERRIERLIDGLSDTAIRQEAIEIIQSMIDSIVITPRESGFDIDLRGDLAGILALMEEKTELPNTESAGSSLSVVAGAGFEPATFRL